MSNYSEVQTEFKNATFLVTALQAQGLKVETHATPTRMRWTRTLAEITVAPGQNGAYEPLGFARKENGALGMLVASEDQRVYGAEWMARVKQSYAREGVMAQAKANGLRYIGEKKVAGKVQLQFAKA